MQQPYYYLISAVAGDVTVLYLVVGKGAGGEAWTESPLK